LTQDDRDPASMGMILAVAMAGGLAAGAFIDIKLPLLGGSR
jgi:hypothetical protein